MESHDYIPKKTNLDFYLILLVLGFISIILFIVSSYLHDEIFKSIFLSLIFVFLVPPCFFYMQKRLDRKTIPRPPIQEYLPMVKKELKILGTSLHDIHKQPENNSFLLNFLTDKKRAMSPINLKFLLLDPDSLFVDEREKEEDGEPNGRIKKECNETIIALGKMRNYVKKNASPHTLDFKIFNAMPKHSTIIVDEERVFMGPYFHQKKGYTTPWMEITDPIPCCEYKKEFEELWRESQEVRIINDETWTRRTDVDEAGIK